MVQTRKNRVPFVVQKRAGKIKAKMVKKTMFSIGIAGLQMQTEPAYVTGYHKVPVQIYSSAKLFYGY